ncbi:hypothetical protein Tco_0866712 [Tanacetum coccineum]
MGSLPSKTVAKPKGRLKGAIYTTRMVLSLMTIRSLPPPFIKSRGSDELVEETFTDPEHGKTLIKQHLNLDKTKDLPPYHDNQLSGNPTPVSKLETKSSSSSPHLSPSKKMFTDEHALDYSSPPLWDDYDDNLFDHETVNDDTYDDPFNFKEEKIKDSKILNDFNPPLYEIPFHKEVPGLGAVLSFSSENEEKVFNPGILTSKRVQTSLLLELSHRSTKSSGLESFPAFS